MTQPTTPRFSDLYNYVQRQSGWGSTFAAKTVRDSVMIGLNLKSRTTSTPPGSGTNGDAYYLPVSPAPTGVWSGLGGKIVAYLTEKPEATAPTTGYTPTAGYVAYTPPRGLTALVQDEGDAQVYYNGTTFAALGLPTVFNFKTACRVASLINVNIASPGAVIDDITLANGDRVLLKNQSTASENGIYVFDTASTPMVRAADADTSAEVVSGMFVPVTVGTVNNSTSWILATNNPIVLGTTPLTFTQDNLGISSDYAPTPKTLALRGSAGDVNFAGAITLDEGDFLCYGSGGDTVFWINSEGQAFNQFPSGYSPNAGQKAGFTLQPLVDELPNANEAPSIMLRTTPSVNAAQHRSARLGLTDVAGGVFLSARLTSLGAQSYFLNLNATDGLVTSKGGLGLASFDPTTQAPTPLATIKWDDTAAAEAVALDGLGATRFSFLFASVQKAYITSAGAGVFASTLAASNLSGTNTGDQSSVSGNAGTATALATARTIGGKSFDGTANIVPAGLTLQDVYHNETSDHFENGSSYADLIAAQSITTSAGSYLKIDFRTLFRSNGGNGTARFKIQIDGADLSPVQEFESTYADNNNDGFTSRIIKVTGLSAASHTVSVQWKRLAGSGLTMNASTSPETYYATLLITEISQ